MKRQVLILLVAVITLSLVAAQCAAQPAAPPEPEELRWQEPIVIGWTPPDITGVFKTATDCFEASA